jgi:putative endonuclease
MFYYVYILQSQKDNSFYIGYTTDLIKRFKQHNSGESQATKPFRPYKLIFYEAFLNRIDAKNRETYLKSGYGRRTIIALLKKYLQNISNPAQERLNSNLLRSSGRAFLKKHQIIGE